MADNVVSLAGKTRIAKRGGCFRRLRISPLSIPEAVRWSKANLCEDVLCRTEVQVVFSEFKKAGIILSDRALGMAIRRAFPSVSRRKSSSKHYYFGIKFASPKNKMQRDFQSTADNGDDQSRNEVFTSAESLQSEKTNKQRLGAEMKTIPNSGYGKHRTHEIASLNINIDELETSDDSPVLGEGTFGKCILGTYKGIDVAVKVLKGTPSWKVVHREANTLLKIPSHPGIPMFIGLFTLKFPYLLVTKFHHYSGKSTTYSHFVKRRKKEQKKTLWNLLITLLDSLMHIHQHGILHNDIKGNNVLVEKLNEQRHCILIDFGKACTLHNAKASAKLPMSQSEREQYRQNFPHVAPEISRGMAPTERSDTYSFGYIFCTTMKETGEKGSVILKLGQELTHWKPELRPNLEDTKKRISALLES